MNLLQDFIKRESSSAIVLLGATIISLVLANIWGAPWLQFWNHPVLAGHSLSYWINDGLMAIFFLMVGLEIEREIYSGELKNPRKAVLPIAAALGGMLVPAGLFALSNTNSPYMAGACIPMATDIAFALGALSLLGARIPLSLKIFVTAFAIIDDLGAILAIALFYGHGIQPYYLVASIFAWLLIKFLGQRGHRSLWSFSLLGLGLWFLVLKSGIHASFAGVMLAFAIPFDTQKEKCLSHQLQHSLHLPVAFGILPLFAIANTALAINFEVLSPNTLMAGIGLGLILGKPIGIALGVWIALKFGASLPQQCNWGHIWGSGFLAGIGFTMSLFISMLAFESPQWQDQAKIAIFVSSALAGAIGLWILKKASTPKDTGPKSTD